ncbi:MAG: efflux RND transporter periplasmic adaptor subunit [Pseudomonadota bacterium]
MVRRLGLALLLAPMLLAACDEEESVQVVEEVRAIKYMALDQRAGQQERRIAGIVSAAISSNVAFETSGQVISLPRNAGDPVNEGDLIGQLDPEPYRFQLSQAESSLSQAEASLEDARRKFEQQQQLFNEGFATQTALDSATATLKNAEGAVGVAQSQLDLARRDLSKTDLRAPFAGLISRKLIEVFEEVAGGQAIYAIQTEGQDKIEAALPETMINTVSLGFEVEVSFPPLRGTTVAGSVSEISPLTGDANAYPIEVALNNIPPGLRPGMSAEVIFQFASDETGVAFSVPLSAVLADAAGGEDAYVFVYQPDSSTLTKRTVKVSNIRDNALLISGDIESGEIIATAGVSFLHDGMTVELLDPNLLR